MFTVTVTDHGQFIWMLKLMISNGPVFNLAHVGRRMDSPSDASNLAQLRECVTVSVCGECASVLSHKFTIMYIMCSQPSQSRSQYGW